MEAMAKTTAWQLGQRFTAREREVLSLIAGGLSNRDIARHLKLTEGTVKQYASRIYVKLGAGNRMQAVNEARALGMLS